MLRRETEQLRDLLDKADNLYPFAYPGAKADVTSHTWRFPSGATIWFTHCEGKEDWKRFHGHEYNLIAFDELTHFTERQYQEITARCRSAVPDLPKMVRATSNPGGEGHQWVFQRFGPWLDPKFPTSDLLPPRFDSAGQPLPPAHPGQVLWVHRGKTHETISATPLERSRTRTFIGAKLQDNPKLLEADPDYEQQLRDNDAVRRAQLEDGDWLATYAKGDFFQRGWFSVVGAAPVQARRVRFWDRAGTEPHKGNKDPDWTVGLRLALAPNGMLFIEDVERFRCDASEVPARIKATAERDGKHVMVGLEQEPGAGGKFEADYHVRNLAGWNVYKINANREKTARAAPVSSQARAGNIALVSGHWHEAFTSEAEAFPLGSHDDQVDALSGAFAVLFSNPGYAPIPKPPTTGDRRSLAGFA